MDDSFLRKVFHKHYTIRSADGVDQKVLTRDNAWLASRDVVQAWNHADKNKAEDYLNRNFEKVW